MNATKPKSTPLQDRLDFIGLDSSALGRIASLQGHIETHLPLALDVFYEKISKVPDVAHFFSDKNRINHAKGRQSEHWNHISAGKLDDQYFAASNTVGQVHAKIGLEPRWHIGGYGIITETLVKGIVHDHISAHFPAKSGALMAKKYGGAEILSGADQMASALTDLIKAVLLDIDIAVSTYFEKIVEETAHLNVEIGRVVALAEEGDFSGRVDLVSANADLNTLASSVNNLMTTIARGIGETGEVLAGLANTDLTMRVSGEYKGSFLDLKTDTNAVADKLTDIVSQLRETSRGVKSATGEILAGANDLSERTTKQAATIEETSAAMDQLSQTVVESAKKAAAAAAKSQAVSQTAEESGEVMNKANTAMERITSSSEKISNIIGMIDDIAFQTNLLALNASVEAARAGEAGKGFAVVAVEVRRLAQSAAEASKDVKVLIEQSASEVSGGSKLVADASQKLADMLSAIRENSLLMESIAADSREQASSIEEVNTAVRQMDEMTQHNAALVEETNAAIEQTETQASELDRIVDVFKLDDSHGQTSVRGPSFNSATQATHAKAKRADTAKLYLNASNLNAALKQEWNEF